MITLTLPLPWELESLWLLFQIGIQLSFVTLIVMAVLAFAYLMIVHSDLFGQ